jgi:hypothetical protein
MESENQTAPNGNANRYAVIVLQWLMPALVAAGVAKFTSINSQGERIAVLEAQVRDISQHLERIEQKIDRIPHP